MKQKKMISVLASSVVSIGLLAGCGMADNDNDFMEPENVRYNNTPATDINDRNMMDNDTIRYNTDRNDTRYDLDDRINFDMDDPTNVRDEVDFDLDNDRTDLMDNPMRMDEEEPDLDEEPSEERRENMRGTNDLDLDLNNNR